jgi:hypothetical protein
VTQGAAQRVQQGSADVDQLDRLAVDGEVHQRRL